MSAAGTALVRTFSTFFSALVMLVVMLVVLFLVIRHDDMSAKAG